MKPFKLNRLHALGLSMGVIDKEKYEERNRYYEHKAIFKKYKEFTMIPVSAYCDNLDIAQKTATIDGDVVECGVWRGGMIAGIAEILPKNKHYWLYDSFEGLPAAGENDGDIAAEWQKNKSGKYYYDNCNAEESYAKKALSMAGVEHATLVKGWFKDTVYNSEVSTISLLRLDGDWYESTMQCLEAFYPKVADGGIILLDDYYFWEGCTRAVHDYLSKNSLTDRIHQSKNGVAYIVKNLRINQFIVE